MTHTHKTHTAQPSTMQHQTTITHDLHGNKSATNQRTDIISCTMPSNDMYQHKRTCVERRCFLVQRRKKKREAADVNTKLETETEKAKTLHQTFLQESLSVMGYWSWQWS
mmetsp:Transcript_53797/g.105223  ORF Transcript_53797/g.105223 Transcript_53797/m.105223 type:complete len:110 (-) Transcript_53797:426-755(-)